MTASVTLERLRDSIEQSPYLWKAIGVVAVILAAALLARIIRKVVAWTYWRRIDHRSVDGVAQLQRTKRQQTIVTLFESIARYVVYGSALFAVIAIGTGGVPGAIFGASLVVLVVGFGMQRLLADVVAGMLLLLEGQFSVGDYISIPQLGVSGIVESFTIRTTTLRALNGEHTTLLNGSITSFTKVPAGYRSFEVLQAVGSGPGMGWITEHAQAALLRVRLLTGERFVELPEEIVPEQASDGSIMVGAMVSVPPSLDGLVHEVLVGELRRQLGEHCEGDAIVTEVAGTDFQRYARNIVVA